MNAKGFAAGLTLIVAQFGASIWCHAAIAENTAQNISTAVTEPMLPAAILALPTGVGAFSRYALLVDKSARTLTVWESGVDTIHLVQSFPVDLGAQAGDKRAEGDAKTPEGIYFFQSTQNGAAVDFQRYGSRIFTTDYPNVFDQLEHKTGRGIWLHSVPESTSLLRGSHGCVVVRNQAIEELTKYIDLKDTPIVIVDQAEYLPTTRWLETQHKIRNWLETWRASWEKKDFATYLAQYSDQFRSDGKNRQQWNDYKLSVMEKSQSLEVALQNVQIFAQGKKLVVRFHQSYRSDQSADAGLKTLYVLRSEPERYSIVGENWFPVRTETMSSARLVRRSDQGSAKTTSSFQ